VRHDKSHDGAWWRAWWEQNKARYPDAVRDTPIPEFPERAASPRAASDDQEDPGADVADVPVQDLRAGGDANKRYLLIGPKAGAVAPPAGYRLIVVLPGGAGGEEFRPFAQRILKNALADDCVVAELVAPRWSEDENRIVWPTAGLKDPAMKFTTDEFVKAVVQDASGRVPLDLKRVDALGWSSGGPPVYAAAVDGSSPLRGAFVAMSVFKPEQLPDLKNAAGKRFYILHSPQDFIQMRFPESARDTLAGAGAVVTLATYQGGHGWQGDVFGMIRTGMDWLDAPAK
jgi:predicted esterase